MSRISYKSQFVVLDAETGEPVYNAKSLPQAKGFIDNYCGGALVFSAIELDAAEFVMQVCIVDDETGQIVARGPFVDLMSAPETLLNLRMMVLPISRTPSQRPRLGDEEGGAE